MNIIIPAAGSGNRFKEDNYDKPKPLINVLGEPLIFHILKNLELDSQQDNIYIIYHQTLDQYRFKYVLLKEFPYLNLNFISLNFSTRGPVETVLCGLNKISNLNEKVLVLDCDTFYIDDIINLLRNEENNAILYFEDNSTQAIFSYISKDQNNTILDIQEKNKISNNACSGAYFFNSGQLLKKYCELTLNNENKSKGEYYISNIYNLLIKNNEKIVAHQIEDFHCLGTPQQLTSYCLKYDITNSHKRICFDLDNTLFTYPETLNDYATVKPIHKNIKLLKYLHKLGHTIIIQTARKMKSSQNNIGKATKEAYQEVFTTLNKYNIPFDEIYFGKPYADFYIDDLAVKPFENIEKELGFYYGTVEPRHFNNLEYKKDSIIKTTNNPGEIYWYSHIPNSIKNHFPIIHKIENNIIEIERINGILFSYLLINNSLTSHNLNLVLNFLDQLHQLPTANQCIYDNYIPKIKNRYQNFNYHEISNKSSQYYRILIDKLKKYQQNDEGILATIHGDLVFSNIFLCENQLVRFIDMRGKLGDELTVSGDQFYDYAKIYQSLLGYDFILNDTPINQTYLSELRLYFKNYFINKFSNHKFEYLKYLTASLFFSLIPLHNDLNKQVKYFQLMEELLNETP